MTIYNCISLFILFASYDNFKLINLLIKFIPTYVPNVQSYENCMDNKLFKIYLCLRIFKKNILNKVIAIQIIKKNH